MNFIKKVILIKYIVGVLQKISAHRCKTIIFLIWFHIFTVFFFIED